MRIGERDMRACWERLYGCPAGAWSSVVERAVFWVRSIRGFHVGVMPAACLRHALGMPVLRVDRLLNWVVSHVNSGEHCL